MKPKDDCKEGHDLIDAIPENHIGSLLTSRGYQYNWIDNIATLDTDFSLFAQNHGEVGLAQPFKGVNGHYLPEDS